MGKKKSLNLFILISIIFINYSACAGESREWKDYQANFISKDGRIYDIFHDNISHSEGQGYGMLLALAFEDKNAFERIWRWTRNNIGVREDQLFAWKWGKRDDGKWTVIDSNNATDGDILIAYALIKAGQKWNEDKYSKRGREIIREIRKKMAFTWQGYSLLLPGEKGFKQESDFIINPSYTIPSAFRLFGDHDDKKFWGEIYSNSLSILKRSESGEMSLPPDWARLSGSKVSPAYDKSPYYGYGAVRTFLYLFGEPKIYYPEGLEKLLALYEKLGYFPLWVDLERESISLEEASAGFYAIYALAAKKSGKEKLSTKIWAQAREKLNREEKSYYSHTLFLLASRETIFQ